MYLFAAERYHWTHEQVDDQPLACYVYLPVLWQVIQRIEDERSRPKGQHPGGFGYG